MGMGDHVVTILLAQADTFAYAEVAGPIWLCEEATPLVPDAIVRTQQFATVRIACTKDCATTPVTRTKARVANVQAIRVAQN
jgi:hypothetical protein